MTKKKETRGRKSLFTQKMADEICEDIISGLSIREICEKPGMPSMVSIFRWVANNKKFQKQYTEAKGIQAEFLAEELLDIADNGENDWMLRNKNDENEGYVANGEHIQRSRLRLDTRKWLMSKMLPKKYGDKFGLDVKGNLTVVIEKDDQDL